MTGLTPDQIAFGSKAKMQPLGRASELIQRLDLGTTGPCALCAAMCERYGPCGIPLCSGCQTRRKEDSCPG